MNQYPFWLKSIVFLLGLVLFYLILKFGKFILMPLGISALLAMILEPLSQQLERLKLGRIMSIICSMLLVTVVLAGVFSLLSLQFVQFMEEIPEANARLQAISRDILAFFENTFNITPERQVEFLQRSLGEIINRGGKYASAAVGATTNVFTTIVILPLFVFFMMHYKEMYRTFLYKAWKGESHKAIDSVLKGVQEVTQNYILGMLAVIVILAVLNGIGLWIVGLDHALFFAVFAAILAIIPYIGVILGSVPAILYALLFTESLLTPVGVIGVFATVQFLEGNFITPNIIGSQVSVNPFVAFIALIIGGEVWGISGMILFVPFLGIMRCVFDEVHELRPYAYLLGNKIEYSRRDTS